MPRKDDLMVNLIGGAIAVVFLAGIIGAFGLVAYMLGDVKCSSRWGERGHFKLIAGCLVDTSEGLVPENAVRVTD